MRFGVRLPRRDFQGRWRDGQRGRACRGIRVCRRQPVLRALHRRIGQSGALVRHGNIQRRRAAGTTVDIHRRASRRRHSRCPAVESRSPCREMIVRKCHAPRSQDMRKRLRPFRQPAYKLSS